MGRAEERNKRCSTLGCPLTARPGQPTCCDYCPKAHVNECLQRHSEDERRQARQHVAASRAASSQPSTSKASAVTTEPDGRSSGVGRETASEGRKPKPKPKDAREASSRASTHETDGLEEVSRQLAAFTAPSADSAVLLAMKSEARRSSKRSAETVAEAQHQAMFGETAKRASGGSSSSEPSTGESEASLPVTTQWVGAGKASVSDEQLKRMIVEMTTLNKKRWSHETVAAVTGGPRGTVQAVMASLSRGPLEAHTQHEFNAIDFGEGVDPLVPDWRNLEEMGVLPKLREAKAAIYAPGSLPKLRTALNHWLRFTATKARVGFLRPRINEDPDAFLTESLLRQGFVADLVAGGCNVDTAQQYMSLFNSWHIDVMGYGVVSSKAFEDEQYKRTNQGLRRLHPATKIDRAAHPIELNGSVLRKSLEGVFEIYDMPGKVTSGRWQAIERALSEERPDGFDRGLITDLVFSAATELATDGLLRPGEIMPKKGFISQSDVSFDHDDNGKLISATVMIVPIKRYGKDVGSTAKRPIVIKANRGGALRTAELLEIISMIAPCRPGDEETTPALRIPVAKTAGLNRRDRKSLANLTLRKVMDWYHDKCAAAGVPHHKKVMPHSFRIGGATALFAAGVTAEEIKTMGRWSSDVYRIYCRLSKERLLQLSHRMSNSRSTQFLNGADGFLSTATPSGEQDLEEVEQQEPGQPPDTSRDEDEGHDDERGLGSDAESDDGAAMTDDECHVEQKGMCDCGPLLTDAQINVGATVAVPFSLGRHQVHFEGTIASILPSTSEVTVAFPGERPWVAARDRLFAVVARRSVASEDDDG